MEVVENAQAKVHTIIFDFASISYVDSTGVKYLKVYKILHIFITTNSFIQEMLRDLNTKGIISLYADVRPNVLKIFKKSGLYREIGEDHFFLRVCSWAMK